MNRIVLIAFLLFCLDTYSLTSEDQKAEIKFEKTVHDFGKFTESNSILTCSFLFTNVGKSPLVITQCVARAVVLFRCIVTSLLHQEKQVQ